MPRIVRREEGAAAPFFHLHTHSKYSATDGMGEVADMVQRAHLHGQPGLALTDHGNMAGAIELYRECSARGMKPFPGCEIYFVHDRGDDKAKRHHLGLVAYTTAGYENLVAAISRSHSAENFHHKPLLSWEDFDVLDMDGVACLSGCYYGLIQQPMQRLLDDNGVATPGEMADVAQGDLAALTKLFPKVFVEFQLHDITHDNGVSESRFMTALLELADRLELPIVATQDSHYGKLAHQPAHDAMKRIVSWGDDPDDAKFPGDGFHLSSTGWMAERHADLWDEYGESYQWLLENHALKIPEADSYHYSIPQITADPQGDLAIRVAGELEARGLARKSVYFDRMAEELEVIFDTGMAGYLLLVAEVTDWCARNKVIYQARGSASGSLLCWLLDITQADPIRYKLRYERFISRDRTKPPDIDIDVAQSRRREILDWLSGRFHITQIGTWLKLGINGPEDEDPGQGSLVARWNSMRKREDPKAGYLKTIDLIRKYRPEDAGLLEELNDHAIYSGAGTHAAGVIVTNDGARMEQLVPTMRIASSKTTVTQYDMDVLEGLGLVKLDILGLRTLDTLARTIEMIGWDTSEGLEEALVDHIPLKDPRTFTMIRRGQVSGVFQLEGGTTTRGCREVGVRKLAELIDVLALYRPAVMISGTTDEYCKRKHGEAKVPNRHDLLRAHIGDTYGLFVYQEQIISLCRELGFDPEDLTKLIKIIKASQKADMVKAARDLAGYEVEFHDRASDAGMGGADRSFAWDSITGFSGYGFNRAHATAYGLTAYRAAFLRRHHPLEYGTAMLETTTGTPKETIYMRAVRREMGIRLLRPDVQISQRAWTIDRKRGAIRRGLQSIKGVGALAADEIANHAPYDDLTDMIERCDARRVTGGKAWAKDGTLKGVLEKLRQEGALRDLGVLRD